MVETDIEALKILPLGLLLDSFPDPPKTFNYQINDLDKKKATNKIF